MSRTLYVETSALLRALLEGERSIEAVLVDPDTTLVASILSVVEAHRAIARGAREGRLSPSEARAAERGLAAFETATDFRQMDGAVVHAARQGFPVEPVRTLDAIHLATVWLFRATRRDLVLLSCDGRVRRNAEAWGVPVLPSA